MEIIYKSSIPRSLNLKLKNFHTVHKTVDIEEIFKIFRERLEIKYIFNGGNTAQGKEYLVF